MPQIFTFVFMDVQKFLDQGEELYLPNVSADVVILGFKDGELKVLLLEFEGSWALPGGYVGKDESVSDAAVRVLEERTGLQQPYLRLFQVFGDRDRNFASEFERLLKAAGYHWNKDLWINDRFVSLAYYALIHIEDARPTGGIFSQPCAWHNLDDLPPMLMDHAKIALESRTQLKRDIGMEQISFNLLPEEFTMPQLHKLHERILERKLERSRFQKKMLSLDIFERLPEPKADAPRRKPFLYRFKKEG